MSKICKVFETDISKLTADQIKDRCSGCLENTGGEQCSHIEEVTVGETQIQDVSPILVPSKGRAGKSKLLTKLNELNFPDTFIFVEPQEIHTYKFNYPNLTIIDIMQFNQGITFVRNLIRRFAEDYSFPAYWMIDDDISDVYRREGNKMIKASLMEILYGAERIFIEQQAWLGALDYQQLAWSANHSFRSNSFCDVAVWHNTARTHGMRYRPEVEGKEDRDFAMQIVKAGGITIRSTLHAFAAPKNGSNAGGLSESFYAQQGREERCVDAMVRMWPGVVTKFVKPDGRIDAKIDWKSLRSGQQNVMSIFNIQ